MIGADIQDPQEVKGQIASIVQTLADSWNSHDMDLYAAQFADDADFVNVLGMHWHGRPEIAARHAEVHRTIFRNSKLRVLDHSVRPLAPDIVLALITWEMTGHETPPGVLFTNHVSVGPRPRPLAWGAASCAEIGAIPAAVTRTAVAIFSLTCTLGHIDRSELGPPCLPIGL